jgi:REP element-mobilizing transposase RayT
VLNGLQARTIVEGFAEYAKKANVNALACAILPKHVHLVLGRHRLDVEQVVTQLKGAATRRLIDTQVHTLAAYQRKLSRPPKVFSRGEGKVFLDSDADIRRAIRYVEENPSREKLRIQRWPFVREYLAR